MLAQKQRNAVLFLFVLLAALALAAAGCTAATAGAQEAAPPTGSITVIGQGEAFGQPDEASVQVGVETFGESVEVASNENEATVQAILAALEAKGIAAEDVQTSNYSLWAEQRYTDEGPQGIVGYRVSNQVSVKVRDINLVSAVLEAVTAAGANSIYGVSFSVADPAALEQEARAEAMADAQARAEELARLGNVEIGEVRIISESIGNAPIPFMGGGRALAEDMAAAAPSIAPGELSFHVQLEVTYNIR
ncbi:MAG: SIMPL domain-containing protein [Candidatus Promineifilaceae bacterium]